jgi:predicted nucleic acid-binding protein
VRVAVVDSSVLINLTHLNLVHELSWFFDRVYVPRAVHKEVNRKGRFRYRLNKLYSMGVLRRCTVANETNVSLLLAELDLGEAEAITQAQENNAPFFVGDEKRARDIARNLGQKPVGTLAILARLELDGRAPQITQMVGKLRKDLQFRVSDRIVRQAIEAAAEPI